jgi:hypothetical protein
LSGGVAPRYKEAAVLLALNRGEDMPSSVLPFRFSGEKKQSTIHLPADLWEEVERITAAERPGKRNDVLEMLLTWAIVQHRA